MPRSLPWKALSGEESEAFELWRAQYRGSYPEFLVFKELERRHYEFGIDFVFQANELGGRNRLGGAVVDFELPGFRIAGRVQGEYWHLSGQEVREHDIVQRLLLEGMGWTVVDMLAEEVLARVHQVVGLFIQGEMTQTARDAGR
jgi:very-short-patch-repair endonuclease